MPTPRSKRRPNLFSERKMELDSKTKRGHLGQGDLSNGPKGLRRPRQDRQC